VRSPTLDGESTPKPAERPEPLELTLEQLRSYQYGIAGVIMPVTDGWRIHYFSLPNFDEEPGTTFPTYEAAMSGLDEVLPVANSPQERERATDELRERVRRSADRLADDGVS
jgi:hypothetical protein